MAVEAVTEAKVILKEISRSYSVNYIFISSLIATVVNVDSSKFFCKNSITFSINPGKTSVGIYFDNDSFELYFVETVHCEGGHSEDINVKAYNYVFRDIWY